MTDAEARKKVDKVLTEQAEKGIKRWQIAVSLFYKGFSEKQVAEIMGFNHRTAHACKNESSNNKTKREITNHLRLDVIRMQGFIRNVKILVGEPFNSIQRKR